MNKEKIRALLYKQFDISLSPQEEETLKAGLKEFPELMKEYKEIGLIRKGLADSSQSSFSPYFKQRVMQRINELDDERNISLFDSMFPEFKKLAYSAVAIIVILASINIGKNGKLSLNSVFNIPDTSVTTMMDSALTFFWSN